MKHLDVLTAEQAAPEAKELFESMKSKFGRVPNIYAVAAHSPSALRALLNFGDTIATGELTASEGEAIALVSAEINECTYCQGAHTAVGKMLGLSEEETLSIRSGTSSDPKLAALVTLTKEIIINKGWPSDTLVNDFLNAGYSKGALVELIGLVSINVFRNYLNHIADTELDFPAAKPLEQVAVA